MKLLIILSLATLVFSEPEEGWLGPQPFAALPRLDCSLILGVAQTLIGINLPSFLDCDADNDNALSWDETGGCTSFAIFGVTSEDSFNAIDTDGDGFLSISEFLALILVALQG